METFKCNPEPRSSSDMNEAKLMTIAVDPTSTRSGLPVSPHLRVGGPCMHTVPTAARQVSQTIIIIVDN